MRKEVSSKKKITIVIAGQPSSNPRAVKEAIVLSEAGYVVTVLYIFWVIWAEAEDKLLAAQYPQITWISVGGHPVSGKLLYAFTRFRNKFYRGLAGIFENNIFIQKRAISRCFPELIREAIRSDASLYIAHNLGSLTVVATAAAIRQSLYSFDAEDYHRGQFTPGEKAFHQACLLEDKFVPGAVYVSAASPLIAATYHQHFPTIHPVVVNNVFSIKYLPASLSEYKSGDTLKIFWFSQTVGKLRGLEEMITAMGKLNGLPVECTILGHCTQEMKLFLLSLAETSGVQSQQLIFNPPVQLNEIFEMAKTHHVGLASETETTANRQLCLTNKIFVYLLSGLATVYNRTKAQVDFFESYPGAGESFHSDKIDELSSILEYWIKNPQTLQQTRVAAIELARTQFNWEKESYLFLQLVKDTIG